MQLREVKPPSSGNIGKNDRKLFLAGSIEMGKAELWQDRVVKALSDVENLIVFNPRRDDWDSSWKQDMSDLRFLSQVNWELNNLDHSDFILMYFDKDTKSPITLLELGRYCTTGHLLVVCPEGYWRRGNVQVMCDRYDVPCIESLEEGIKLTKQFFTSERTNQASN